MKKIDLDKMKIKPPFEVPKGFFEDLHKQIQAKTTESESRIVKEEIVSPFAVPEGYFDQLNDAILAKAENDDSPDVELKTRNNLWWSVAAAVLLLLVSIPLVLINQETTTEQTMLADVSNEEILLYLDYYEVDEIDLMESIDENMEWLQAEDELLEELDINSTNLDDLYLEYGLSEIM